MPVRRGHVAPRTTLIETIIRKFDTDNRSFLVANSRQGTYHIIYCSDGFCRLTGHSRAEVMQRTASCNFLWGPLTSQHSVNVLREALSSGVEKHAEVLYYKKDGTKFLCSEVIAPIRSEIDDISLFIINFEDLTSPQSLTEESTVPPTRLSKFNRARASFRQSFKLGQSLRRNRGRRLAGYLTPPSDVTQAEEEAQETENSPLTSSCPAPILEQNWISKDNVADRTAITDRPTTVTLEDKIVAEKDKSRLDKDVSDKDNALASGSAPAVPPRHHKDGGATSSSISAAKKDFLTSGTDPPVKKDHTILNISQSMPNSAQSSFENEGPSTCGVAAAGSKPVTSGPKPKPKKSNSQNSNSSVPIAPIASPESISTSKNGSSSISQTSSLDAISKDKILAGPATRRPKFIVVIPVS